VSLTFVTPLGALIALVGLIPLAVLVVEDRRLGALCEKLGLRPPSLRPSVEVGVALTVLVAVLALALAQPVIGSHTTLKGRADAEAFFVFDVSRSMGARTANSPTRFDQARRDAKELRARLGNLPVGVASLTDRVLPHLFPSVSVNAFNATLDESLAVDRPTMSLAYGDSVGTKIGALVDLVNGNYFEATATKRVVIVFTDGETLKERLSTLPARFKDGNLHVFFFHYWSPDQRVYNAAGQIDPAYLPDPSSTPILEGLAQSTSSRVFKPGQVGQAAAAVRAVIGKGPTTARGRELNSFLLAPYVLLFAILPLGFLLFRRNFPRRLSSGLEELAEREDVAVRIAHPELT
jgi:von Willebrand factor type A domain